MKKSFFFVRTKIDIDIWNNDQTKNIKEDATLSEIREDCLANLRSFGADDEVVFLISNLQPIKWNFARLTEAILDGLPTRLKECLTLSLDLLTTKSKDILKRKADILRGNFKVKLSGGSSVSQNKLPQLILGYIYILKYLQSNFIG